MNTPAVKVGGGVGESSAVSKDKVVMGTLGFEDEEGAVDPSSLSAVSAVSGSSGEGMATNSIQPTSPPPSIAWTTVAREQIGSKSSPFLPRPLLQTAIKS